MNFYDVEYLYNYDGDTLTVNIPNIHPLLGKKIPIRVRGIDTAELRSKQPKAYEAKSFVSEILSKAKKIDLIDIERGKYFRIVADVYVDGVSLAELLLDEGLAVEKDYE